MAFEFSVSMVVDIYFASLSLLPLFLPLFVSVKFNGDHKTAYTDEVKFGHPHFWDYYRI